MRAVPSLRTAKRAPLLQVLKTSAAAIVAWLVSVIALDQPLPIFAAIAALLVVQPSVTQSLTKGLERSVGVIGGVVLAYLVGQFLGNASWIVLSVIVVSLLIAWALRLGPGSTNQIPISAMLVLAIGDQTPAYALDRIIETIIGAGVALILNALIVPPVLLRPAHLAISRLLRETADALDALSAALRMPVDAPTAERVLERARSLRPLRDAAADAVAAGEESLAFNPRRSRHRRVLENDAELLARLSALVTRVIGMARALRDHRDPTLHREATVQAIATELERAAHDLRLLDRDPDGEPPTVTAELPALTAPLAVATPHPEHWILIGSLLEDLRRVREEIVGGRDN
ncbi:aromatic acid exporter family member 1 [Diaminobutyricimonas aerilata]|uniref:Aromatic acid exporter family member 1 n=1 Tax=Diaminobutyricimonas aerilata TaxID=1162967 RepID=A0A2M9CJA3_9MICO|nr:FUSC family protein [Diaminobutyricimonas aerilata]PJJ71989.1 aromatic acid exporter family member 1 [Diaminobutyricimonas aerilata]